VLLIHKSFSSLLVQLSERAGGSPSAALLSLAHGSRLVWGPAGERCAGNWGLCSARRRRAGSKQRRRDLPCMPAARAFVCWPGPRRHRLCWRSWGGDYIHL